MHKKGFFISILLLMLAILPAQAQDLAKGEEIFQKNCTSCHALGRVLIGPNLEGVKSRWDNFETLKSFVRNSQAVIQSGHPYANALFKKFNEQVMTPQNLSDEEIEHVLAYVDAGGNINPPPPPTGGNPPAEVQPLYVEETSMTGFLGMTQTGTTLFFLLLFLVLLLLIVVLVSVQRQLRQMRTPAADEAHEEGVEHKAKNIWNRTLAWWDKVEPHINPNFLAWGIGGILMLLAVLHMYDAAQDLGTQVAYAPEQPIKFSHKLHAGTYGIQCQYCHTGVTKGKNAGIPSVNTCMNCHNYVEDGPMFGNAEISKIHAAAGWDAAERQYTKKPQAVEWVRVHNLPAHVYFNHSQHVVAGGLDCQNCHGAVQEMDRVQAISTLEMGWCVNCHRQTEVNEENPYYTSTYDFVEKHEKYTIAQMGGLECSKCHY